MWACTIANKKAPDTKCSINTTRSLYKRRCLPFHVFTSSANSVIQLWKNKLTNRLMLWLMSIQHQLLTVSWKCSAFYWKMQISSSQKKPICYMRASWKWKPLWTAGESVCSWTHHVWLIHLDGHFTDSVCCFVDHFQEAGAAQSLGAHCSGQLKTHTHIMIQLSPDCTSEMQYTQGDHVRVNDGRLIHPSDSVASIST